MLSNSVALPRLKSRRRFRRPGKEEVFHVLWMANGLSVVGQFVVRPSPWMAFLAFCGLLVYGVSYIQRRWLREYEEDGENAPWPPPTRWDWCLVVGFAAIQVFHWVKLLA